MDPDLGGPHGYPEGRGNLLVGQIVIDAEQQRRPFAFRKVAKSAQHRAQVSLVVEPTLGGGGWGVYLTAERHLACLAAAPGEVGVPGYGQQVAEGGPGLDPRRPCE